MNTIWALAQSRDGYIWFGSEEGLARFDGVRFRLFDRAGGQATPGLNVLALCPDRDGALWIGSYDAGLFHEARSGIQPARSLRGRGGQSIRSIVQGVDGVVWVGAQGGLYRRVPGVDDFTRVEGFESVQALAGGGAGRLWVASGTRLTVLSEGGARRSVALPQAGVSALAEGPDGRVWIGTARGLLALDGNGFTTYSTRDGLPNDFVQALLFDRHGSLWVGTNGGLGRFRASSFEALTVADGLPSNLITSLLEDQEGGLWIATRGGGVTRLMSGDFVTYGTRAGHEDNIDVICAARRGGLWVAGWGGNVARLEVQGRFDRFPSRETFPENDVRALFEDARGSLWIGTFSGLYRARDGRIDRVEHALPNVRAVLEDRRGDLWIGLDNEGLARWNAKGIRRFTTRDGLGGNQVRALLEDPDGTLWIATYGGLTRYRDGVFTTLTKADGLPSDLVRCLHRDPEGVLWIGTYGGGLARLKEGHLTAYTPRQGLVTGFAYAIVEDDLGSLWVSTNKGIYRIAKKELNDHAARPGAPLKSDLYGESDGMASRECNGGSPSAWKTSDGRLWFATVKGVAVVDPAHVDRSEPPPAMIEDVIVEGARVDPSKECSVEAGARRFEFHYVGLSFAAAKKLVFRYRLEGFDEGWIEAGSRREAYYTNIPPGRYRFRVVAGSGAVWKEPGAFFDFRLAPRFTQTSLFYLLLACGLAAIVAGLHVTRVARHRARERELGRRVDEALAHAKTLRGLLPICSSCKKIRDDNGYWTQLERYLHVHTDADFSHGMCPDCMEKLYPEFVSSAGEGAPGGRDPSESRR